MTCLRARSVSVGRLVGDHPRMGHRIGGAALILLLGIGGVGCGDDVRVGPPYTLRATLDWHQGLIIDEGRIEQVDRDEDDDAFDLKAFTGVLALHDVRGRADLSRRGRLRPSVGGPRRCAVRRR